MRTHWNHRIHYRKQRYQAAHTTPDVITNHKMLREMVDQGCRSAVMEVSSHGLDQGRVDQIDYDVAIFSNLTFDHLDYHGTMENYAESKSLLFRNLGKIRVKKGEKWAIVNQDSPWTPRISKGVGQCPLLMESRTRRSAGIEHSISPGWHSCNDFLSREEPILFLAPCGRFNIYNCLAAMGVPFSEYSIRVKRLITCLKFPM